MLCPAHRCIMIFWYRISSLNFNSVSDLRNSLWLWRFLSFEAPTKYCGLLELLSNAVATDTWDDAELWSVYRYAFGSKHLNLPAELKQAMPR